MTHSTVLRKKRKVCTALFLLPLSSFFVYFPERFSVPVLTINPDTTRVESGSPLTFLCSTENFTNDTLTYAFFNGGSNGGDQQQQQLIQNGTDQALVIGKASTNHTGNYTCQSKWNSLVKRSEAVLVDGNNIFNDISYQ